MKKLLLSFALFVWAFTGKSQITLYDTDYPSVDDTIVSAWDTAFGGGVPIIGGTGSQTWDFSSLQVNFFDTLFFVAPASAPEANFGAANMVMKSSILNTYINKSASKMSVVGMYGDPSGGLLGVDLALKFKPTMEMMYFPANWQDQFGDTAAVDTALDDTFSGQQFNDSLRILRTIISDVEIDAYGSITTPAGTFDALRIRRTEITIDSVFNKTVPIPFVNPNPQWALVPPIPGFLDENPTWDTLYRYTWVATGEGFSVCEIEVDAQGNPTRASFKITDSLVPMILSNNNTACSSACSGAVTASGLSGTPPYTYLWSDGQTDATAVGLCEGAVSLTITDLAMNTASTTVTVEANPQWSTTMSTTNSTCGASDGQVMAIPTGGNSPHAYLWSNGGTTQIISNIDADVYSVSVTDNDGCVSTSTSTVTENTTPSWSVSVAVTNATCGTCADGQATANPSGGNTPYTFAWSNGGSTQTIVGLSPSNYSVTVTDATNCVGSTLYTVTKTTDLMSNINLAIYPNPANDFLTIETTKYVSSVNVFDVTGRKMDVAFSSQSGIKKVDVSKLPSGVYIMTLQFAEGEQHTSKFVKE